ncbi:MAG: hypothetical protein P4N24_14190 [Acidobacteriota bacterium]|nr:hypothetical protein [Acidobacteriota bacterium]
MSARSFETSACHERATRKWRKQTLWMAIAFLVVPIAFPKEGMDRDTRIDIIRGLLREVAVTKIPMPRGKRGVRVNAKGKLDQDDAIKELRSNGVAMQPGVPAEITKIEFKANQIIFELNNGGRSGKKWYQHIEIGMGGTTSPMGPQQQAVTVFGSSVTLDYGKALPDLTIPQVKKILSGVLDFERHSPTVLYSPNVTPAIREAIKNHNVIVGMDRDAVLSAKGTPDRRVREVRNGDEQEDWIYGTPPHVLFITFDGELVVSVKQY